MKRQRSKIQKAIILLILIIFGIGTYIYHEKRQDYLMDSLLERITYLESHIQNNQNIVNSSVTENVLWSDNSFNYLAIGNSITKHNVCEYWWNENGMAASKEELDYFHLVVDFLETENKDVVSYAYNFSVWETQSYDRYETLSLLDFILDEKIDLVTIQLGENASDLSSFETDYESLINYITYKVPNAKIIVVGDYWSYENRDDLKRKVANICKVSYVSLEMIKDNSEYQCGLGTEVYDTNGNPHIIDHNGVAYHPGDNGMQIIASLIIETIREIY